MRHPREQKKRKNGREPSPPKPMSIKYKLQTWVLLAGLVLAFALYFHFIATVVIGGIISSTLLVLPVLYRMFHRREKAV